MKVGESCLQGIKVLLDKAFKVLQSLLLASDDLELVLLNNFFQIIQGEIIYIQGLLEDFSIGMSFDIAEHIFQKLLQRIA